MDFTPHEMSGEIKARNLITKYAKPKMKNTTTSSHPGDLEPSDLSWGLKKRKCLQSRTRRLKGGKNVSTSYSSPFSLQIPAGLPLLFFWQKIKKIKKPYIFLIHRKLWLGSSNPPRLGVLGESLVFPPSLPGALVLGGDFLGAGGGAEAEDAAAAAPGGADSAGEGGAAAAAGPWRVARSRPPGRKRLASAGAAGAPSPGRCRPPSSRSGLLASTRLRRQEAPVSSRRLLL